jgi:hypothetical protein
MHDPLRNLRLINYLVKRLALSVANSFSEITILAMNEDAVFKNYE